MDRTTFRILDVLARSLGRPVSILELARRISRIHGNGFYKNIYDKIQEMREQEIVKISQAGNTSLVSLNFDNYSIASLLGELENEKKRRFLEDYPEIIPLMQELDFLFRKGFYMIRSIFLSEPEKTASRRRAELIFLLADPLEDISEIPETKEKMEEGILRERTGIYSIAKMTENRFNIRIDPLILKKSEFFALLESGDPETGRILSDQIAFFRPDDFWIIIKEALRKTPIKEADPIDPAKTSENDILYNAGRLGYSEFGAKMKGKELPLEYIIISMLLSGNRRWIEAVPVILAKNEVNYSLLVFLSKKYNTLESLLGILKAISQLKKRKDIEYAVRILEKMELREEKADMKGIRQKLELYHAI